MKYIPIILSVGFLRTVLFNGIVNKHATTNRGSLWEGAVSEAD